MTPTPTLPPTTFPAIERLELPSSDLRSCIVAPLAEFSTKKDFSFTPRYVTLALKDERGVDGGLIAQVYWDWMHVEILAVPERWRGRGLGRALMERAEAIARDEGCTGVWVDTYSFQSPGFYEAMGYLPFGRLPNYPKGEERIFFAKLFNDDQSTETGRAA
ncbi:GNAT family N-acetyltransferase [Jiella sp. 40Bstr34]|uniref:GNAT family N-acetyltransferase n=2 Tax=Jiella pacifica TaxID=2696469 RepID=A0A6N9SXF6_9HYPH|nr:GNAT family N-acetyltransferase [Jiella pacifica]